MMELLEIKTPYPLLCHYIGEPIEKGILPALFYFALSSEESLNVAPFNGLLSSLQGFPLRVFSFSLPFHETAQSKFEAMGQWAQKMKEGSYFLEEFLDHLQSAIEWLIHEKIVDPTHIAAAGLSRGGLIATHMAKREKRIQTLLGLAPLTSLAYLEEFRPFCDDPLFTARLNQLKLTSLTDELIHLRSLRFYIGNRDERVSTDLAFEFVRKLVETAHEKRARHCLVELFLTPSIGHKGHGTAPHIFREGGLWIKNALLKE